MPGTGTLYLYPDFPEELLLPLHAACTHRAQLVGEGSHFLLSTWILLMQQVGGGAHKRTVRQPRSLSLAKESPPHLGDGRETPKTGEKECQ